MYEDDDFQEKNTQQKPISLSNVEMRLLLSLFFCENHAADVQQAFSDIGLCSRRQILLSQIDQCDLGLKPSRRLVPMRVLRFTMSL